MLEFCDEDSLDDNEIFWIDYFDSTNPVKGYNLESGGRANRTVSRETRKKLSNLMKGNKIWLGRTHSEETKKKISEGNKGRIFSKETLRKFSEVNSGENNPNYGKQYSLDERVKLSKAQNNSTGFYRVSKKRKKSCKNGFTFEYSYYEGTRRKFLSSVSLLKLKEKVLGKGLDWCIIDEGLAMQTLENELGVQS